MKKRTTLCIVLMLIFIALFNAVFFLTAGFKNPVSVWISYGFIHFASLMVPVTAILAPKLAGKGKAKESAGCLIYSSSAVYFVVEFIVGLIFVIIRSKSYKIALVIQLILAGIYAISFVLNIIAVDKYYGDRNSR